MTYLFQFLDINILCLFTAVYFKNLHGAGEMAHWARAGTALADS